VNKIAKKTGPKKIKRMGSSRCFMIMFDSPARMVLQVDPLDKYRPRKTGVYNVFLAEVKNKKDPARALQLWYYNGKKKALLSRKYPSKGLFEGFNKNLIVFKYRGLKNQVWSHDLNSHQWFNEFSKNSLTNPEGSKNVVTTKMKSGSRNQKFKLTPC